MQSFSPLPPIQPTRPLSSRHDEKFVLNEAPKGLDSDVSLQSTVPGQFDPESLNLNPQNPRATETDIGQMEEDQEDPSRFGGIIAKLKRKLGCLNRTDST